MTIYLTVGQEKLVKARLTDAAGEVADDAITTWSSNAAAVSVTMSPEDHNHATVKGNNLGTATITASNGTVTGTITVIVHSGATTTVSVTG